MSSFDFSDFVTSEIDVESLIASIMYPVSNACETTPSSSNSHVSDVSKFPPWSTYDTSSFGNPGTSSGTNWGSSGIDTNCFVTTPGNGNPGMSSGTNGDSSGFDLNFNFTSPANGNHGTSSGTNGDSSGIDTNCYVTSLGNGNPGMSSGTNGDSSGIDSNSNVTLPSNEGQTTTEQLLSSSKYSCCVCGDRSEGKHYGVYSCEGCKGFFKRTVRNKLSYICRKRGKCVIDHQRRARCQSCRYEKCLNVGMKTGKVQKPRDSKWKKDKPKVKPTSSGQLKTPLEPVTEIEKRLEVPNPVIVDNKTKICVAAETELFYLVRWAARNPYYNRFSLKDRVVLLRCAWNELLILSISYRPINQEQALVFASGFTVNSDLAGQVGLRDLFVYVLKAVGRGLRYTKVDKTEFSYLLLIILFNPASGGLPKESIPKVRSTRDKMYAGLKKHTNLNYPQQPNRCEEILSNLTDIKTVSSACQGQLLFNHVINDGTTIDYYLINKLATPADKQQFIRRPNV